MQIHDTVICASLLQGQSVFPGPEAILDRGHFSPDRFLLAVEVVGNLRN